MFCINLRQSLFSIKRYVLNLSPLLCQQKLFLFPPLSINIFIKDLVFSQGLINGILKICILTTEFGCFTRSFSTYLKLTFLYLISVVWRRLYDWTILFHIHEGLQLRKLGYILIKKVRTHFWFNPNFTWLYHGLATSLFICDICNTGENICRNFWLLLVRIIFVCFFFLNLIFKISSHFVYIKGFFTICIRFIIHSRQIE